MEMGLHIVLVILDRGFFDGLCEEEAGLSTVTTVPTPPRSLKEFRAGSPFQLDTLIQIYQQT
jgi:hypothetical protein